LKSFFTVCFRHTLLRIFELPSELPLHRGRTSRTRSSLSYHNERV
jgi:hypothetical protein